ncbi:hypothetical protein [Elstera sp.]|uniref:hypothetical protein n=1 Tax=Elstera sp. TaxID=1916664 RepID=UPI0037C04E78
MSTRPPPDPNAPDLNALAEQFLDLWQGQVSAWASDPATTESMARLWALWGLTPPPGHAASAPSSASGPAYRAVDPAASQPFPGRSAPPLGAAPAAAASPELLELLLKLAARLAAVEQRLADLEGADAAPTADLGRVSPGPRHPPKPYRRRGRV